MDEQQLLRSILIDLFDRVAEQVNHVTSGLSEADATARIDPDANTIGWLIWHLSRVQDAQVADLAGTEQVWTAQGFADRFALPFPAAASGYGQSSAQVAEVTTAPADLAGYHAAVHQATVDYLKDVDAQELSRVVDTSWDPPVTAAVRLVSIVNDVTDHVGQAEYLKGHFERVGS